MATAIKFLVLTAVIATIAFAIIREGINYLEYPSLQILSFPGDNCELTLYHRGIANRHATLFIRSIDHRAPPQRIADLNYSGDEKTTRRPQAAPDDAALLGKLSWTSDHTAVVATARASRLRPDPPALWLFDTGSRMLYEAGQVLEGQRLGEEHLNVLLKVKGGIGTTILNWYDLGKKDHYLFSWKAHHWNQLAGDGHRSDNSRSARTDRAIRLPPVHATGSTLP